jgi:hypothetical protein
MPEERRQGYELISTQLSAIQDKIGTMHTELALNTRETSRIAKAQETTNGKVAAHEVRQQSLEANQAVMATALAEIKTTKQGWEDWLKKGVVVLILSLAYYVLIHNGFPNFLN